MSSVIKMQEKKGAEKTGGVSGPAGRMASLPASDDFLSFEDFWQRSGTRVSSGQASAREEPVPKVRDERELARQQAEEMIKQAQAEVARIEQEAHDKGFAKGEQEGLAEGRKEFDAQARQLGEVLAALREERATVGRQYERDLLTLIKTMVDRLVHQEVSVNPLVIRACLQKAMEFVVENSFVKVHLHPDDFHRIKEAGLTDPSLLGGKNRLQIIEDPALSAGGCLLKTDFGEIDATLENSRDRLYEAVDRAFLAALAADASGEPAGRGEDDSA